MKRLLHIIMISITAVALIGCGDKKGGKKDSIRVGRGGTELRNGVLNPGIPQTGVTYPNRTYSPTGGRTWGTIYGGSVLPNESDFNWAVHEFVAATLDPEQLGTVSSSPNASTGIRFWGNVEISGTTIKANTAELRIVIWDSYAGMVDSTGEVIPEYPVHIVGNASGQISGNRAVVRFQDQYGWIQIDGTFDSQNFQGFVWFDNYGGSAYYLGSFYIPTCSFFRCN